MSPKEIFGIIIQDIRTKRGFSQEQLGFESGYHRTYISLLERGQKNPSLNTIFRLAKSLGVKPSELLLRVEEQMAIDSKHDNRGSNRENNPY